MTTVTDICNESCTVEYDFVPPCDFVPTEDMVCDGGADILECLATKWFCDGADAIPDNIDMGSVPYNSASSCAVAGLPTMKSLMSQLGAYNNGVANMFKNICGQLGYCNLDIPNGTFFSERLRANMPGEEYSQIAKITIPAFDCPVNIFLTGGTYADIYQTDPNAGQAFYTEMLLGLNSPSNIVAGGNMFHADGETTGAYHWSKSAPVTAVIAVGAGTPTDLYVVAHNDLPPAIGPTVYNLYMNMAVWWIALPQ